MLPSTIPANEVRAHLQHALSSASFDGSGRASTLLAFLVDQTLGGAAERLKEYTIGVEALGKAESFDPRTDPIVRTEMSRLRTRLEKYYATAGRSQNVAIALRKGSYVPEFIRAAEAPAPPIDTARKRVALQSFGWGVVAATVVVGLLGVYWRQRPRSDSEAAEIRLEINTPPTTDPASIAMSPDGRRVVFVATVDGGSRLWLRELNAEAQRAIAGTARAEFPFWSPDSRSVGFMAAGSLKVVDLDTGSIRVLARNQGQEMRGGTWNREGTIVFNYGPGQPLFRIPADGGEKTAVTRLSSGVYHSFPEFLPDGRHFLYFAPSGDAPGLYAGRLDAPDRSKRILDNVEAATYQSSHLLFVRERTLFAQAFDPDRLEVSGQPSVVATQILVSVPGRAALSTSANGSFVYRTGVFSPQTELVWFDRTGRELERVAGSAAAGRRTLALSPDGSQVLFEQIANGSTTTNIWVMDVARGVSRRLTSDSNSSIYPIWSPDATRFAFSSMREGTLDVYLKRVDGTGVDERLIGTDRAEVTMGDWSPDGRVLLYMSSASLSKATRELYGVRLDGDRRPFPVLTGAGGNSAQFTADGRWIAYTSSESESADVYVRPFPGLVPRVQISGGGGKLARWRRDGRELFFLSADNRLMAVPITLDPARQWVDVGKPAALFSPRLPPGTGSWRYAVSPNGQRFLIDTPKDVTLPITVVLNRKGP